MYILGQPASWPFFSCREMREIAVSDIHGCLKSLRALLFEQVKLSRQDHLFLLGDYVDRGPDSKGVLDLIMRMKTDGYRISPIRGNHDDIFVRLSQNCDPAEHDNWEIFGGTETLVSFDAFESGFDGIDRRYIHFMDALPYYAETASHIMVHAGVATKGDLFGDKMALLWCKDWYERMQDPNLLGGRKVVHGHVPHTRQAIEDRFRNWDIPVLPIDAGCCYAEKEGMGYLCAYDMTREKLFFQPNLDEISYMGD